MEQKTHTEEDWEQEETYIYQGTKTRLKKMQAQDLKKNKNLILMER